ncbi:M20/M25/M40 family metallo-hydrolase, partial [Candidatus Bathyarchaeota archaeon]|nr:M20/M25/M40 family metallo-hydrolase [Candidatus Bathyarchaeota archaeon]
DAPIIFLCGHMDTVSGFIPVKMQGNLLYGRGAVDAKASLAAMIVAASIFENERDAKIVVAAVVDEEGNSRGIRHLLKEGINADYAIFGEPSGVEKITIGYKGVLRLEILCETNPGPGHSSANHLYTNAIERAFELWQKIRNIHFEVEKLESPFYSLSSSVTRIEGGQDYSTIPSKCILKIDMRVPPKLTTSQVLAEVNKVIEQFKKDNAQVNVKTKVEEAIEAFESNPKSILVRALFHAIREVRGKTPMLVRKTGTGDMNLLGRAMNIPTVTYGPGDSSLCHTENEHIDIKEYLDSIEVYRRAIEWIIKLHCRN